MTHIMIDLETLARTPNSAIIQIGAVVFRPDEVFDHTLPSFSTCISLESAMEGRHVDPDTVRWWLGQSTDARAKVMDARDEMPKALIALSSFCQKNCDDPAELRVWGNGATFDISMLEDAYRQYLLEVPWPHWGVRDVRTVVDLAAPWCNKKDFPFMGTPHVALDDAMHQARYVSTMWQILRREKP